MSKVCLSFVFNHQFEKNIPKLRELYDNRFSTIRFLSPFSKTDDKQIIPVHEKSIHFQGYFAQSFAHLPKDCEYYVFCGDDLILNPSLNEQNLIEQINCSGSAYIKYLNPIWEHSFAWHKFKECNSFPNDESSVPSARFLPPRKELLAKYSDLGFNYRNIGCHNFWGIFEKKITLERIFNGIKYFYCSKLKRYVYYPLIEGYSDFIVIPQKYLESFCFYCGVFAAMNLWVDAAVATAMVLSCDSIKMEKDHRYNGVELWGHEQQFHEDRYQLNFQKFYQSFPKDQLYLHPVKLSKWNA